MSGAGSLRHRALLGRRGVWTAAAIAALLVAILAVWPYHPTLRADLRVDRFSFRYPDGPALGDTSLLANTPTVSADVTSFSRIHAPAATMFHQEAGRRVRLGGAGQVIILPARDRAKIVVDGAIVQNVSIPAGSEATVTASSSDGSSFVNFRSVGKPGLSVSLATGTSVRAQCQGCRVELTGGPTQELPAVAELLFELEDARGPLPMELRIEGQAAGTTLTVEVPASPLGVQQFTVVQATTTRAVPALLQSIVAAPSRILIDSLDSREHLLQPGDKVGIRPGGPVNVELLSLQAPATLHLLITGSVRELSLPTGLKRYSVFDWLQGQRAFRYAQTIVLFTLLLISLLDRLRVRPDPRS